MFNLTSSLPAAACLKRPPGSGPTELCGVAEPLRDPVAAALPRLLSGEDKRMAGKAGGLSMPGLRWNISRVDMEAPSWRFAAARLLRLSWLGLTARSASCARRRLPGLDLGRLARRSCDGECCESISGLYNRPSSVS